MTLLAEKGPLFPLLTSSLSRSHPLLILKVVYYRRRQALIAGFGYTYLFFSPLTYTLYLDGRSIWPCATTAVANSVVSGTTTLWRKEGIRRVPPYLVNRRGRIRTQNEKCPTFSFFSLRFLHTLLFLSRIEFCFCRLWLRVCEVACQLYVLLTYFQRNSWTLNLFFSSSFVLRLPTREVSVSWEDEGTLVVVFRAILGFNIKSAILTKSHYHPSLLA